MDINDLKVGDRVVVNFAPGRGAFHYGVMDRVAGTSGTVREVDPAPPSACVLLDEGGKEWFRDMELSLEAETESKVVRYQDMPPGTLFRWEGGLFIRGIKDQCTVIVAAESGTPAGHVTYFTGCDAYEIVEVAS